MAYDLHRAGREVVRYGHHAPYAFTANRHLVVHHRGGNKTVFSAHSWDRIEEPVPAPGE